ncbi:MAG: Calx-beta domain-containing protein, partial [Acidobacteriota bacterium]
VELGEGDGPITLVVRREGGSDGEVSVRWSTTAGSAVAGEDFSTSSGTLRWAEGEDGDQTIQIPVVDDDRPEATETFTVRLSSTTGGAGLGTSVARVTVRDDDLVPFECVADDETLCLAEGRFQVTIDWADFEGGAGAAKTVPVGSDRSGMFWFFDRENWEMLVKVLDGCGVNGHHWVLLAATTNIEYTVTVIDTAEARLREYRNDLGSSAPATTDIEAFTCP